MFCRLSGIMGTAMTLSKGQTALLYNGEWLMVLVAITQSMRTWRYQGQTAWTLDPVNTIYRAPITHALASSAKGD